MSEKINVNNIIKGHISTLRNDSTQKYSAFDISTFYILPIIFSAIGIFYGFKLTDSVTSLLVNFGAIFTALLLSVLVLVYDQSSKIEDRLKDKKMDVVLKTKSRLLNQLYYNICYAIILSLALVLLSFSEKILNGIPLEINTSYFNITINFDVWLFAPLAIFLTLNLIFTILMVVKRMHALLVSK